MQHPLPRALILALTLTLGAGTATAGSPVEDADFLDAVTWGISASSYQELRTLGREQWLKAQLAPPAEPRLSSAARSRIDDLRASDTGRERLLALKTELKTVRDMGAGDGQVDARKAIQSKAVQLQKDATESAILRALLSRDQIRERLAWFWFNHFNVRSQRQIRSVLGDYVDTAIRPHVLGRFRDLLMATVRHPAMLHYLDNALNRANKRNENYAREIMELHTMGVGSGYSQADVENLARILTGVSTVWQEPPNLPAAKQSGGISLDNGFTFNPRFHDFGDKKLLGKTIRGRGWAEVEEAIDIISAHPATARRISRQLATYFMGGVAPTDALVGQLAAVFTRSDGRIATVVDALFRSPEFEASLGKQFKDPLRFVLSAVRLAHDERDVENALLVQRWLRTLGQGLFERSTPDGYPLEPSAWNSPGQLLARFDVAKQIGSGRPSLFTSKSAAAGATNISEASTPHLQSDFYGSVLEGTMSERSRSMLSKAKSPEEWNTLFLSSPEFMK